MKITGKGQVTIPEAMRRRHGLLPRHEVELVDQPEGVLVTKAGKPARGKRVLAAFLRGGKVKGDTAGWLKLTRGCSAVAGGLPLTPGFSPVAADNSRRTVSTVW